LEVKVFYTPGRGSVIWQHPNAAFTSLPTPPTALLFAVVTLRISDKPDWRRQGCPKDLNVPTIP